VASGRQSGAVPSFALWWLSVDKTKFEKMFPLRKVAVSVCCLLLSCL